jgi:hypothetical protein
VQIVDFIARQNFGEAQHCRVGLPGMGLRPQAAVSFKPTSLKPNKYETTTTQRTAS